MTDNKAREYFRSLAAFLEEKDGCIESFNPVENKKWIDEIFEKMQVQATCPTRLRLYSSTSALESEFIKFLRNWITHLSSPCTETDTYYHAQMVMAAGVYLRQLTRLYREILL